MKYNKKIVALCNKTQRHYRAKKIKICKSREREEEEEEPIITTIKVRISKHFLCAVYMAMYICFLYKKKQASLKSN